ncbi:2-amino-4-hydroxy-6-hydroxymethyldihydropteridine diphosphokinase, partial [Streptococcus sobrinus]
MSSVFLSLGSNMGDRRANLKEALERLDQLPQTQLLAVSSLYQT